MKVQMHSIKFNADVKLLDYIKKRANKLDTFYDRIIDGEVFMRVEKNDHNQNKTIEFKVNIPGEQLFAREHSRTFEAATDLAVESLKRQLKKYKGKKYKR
ncbi:ribosome hibernation-promoting factor, HPF/YfiA family [Bacteroidota bacterium]